MAAILFQPQINIILNDVLISGNIKSLSGMIMVSVQHSQFYPKYLYQAPHSSSSASARYTMCFVSSQSGVSFTSAIVILHAVLPSSL